VLATPEELALEIEKIKLEIAAFKLKKMKPAEVSEAIALDLISRFKEYKKKFNQPLPACKQCSELEMLLILKRALETGNIYSSEDIRSMLYYAKKEEIYIGDKLKIAEMNYEEKFGKPIPWWWLCSDKERLKRLEKSLETNSPYPDYHSNYTVYKLGKAMAEYEIRFKRQFPECHCSDEEHLKRLNRSLKVGTPYITKEEETELDAKLRSEYEKRFITRVFGKRLFGTPITDFELSMASAYIYINTMENLMAPPRISVVKTATGATAKYLSFRYGEDFRFGGRDHTDSAGIELNTGEWLDFVKAIQELHINEMKREEYDYYGVQWHLEISFLVDGELEVVKFWGGSNAYPPNWNKFMKIIEGIVAKINKETGTGINEKSWWRYPVRYP
jgi:hypothetical protein